MIDFCKIVITVLALALSHYIVYAAGEVNVKTNTVVVQDTLNSFYGRCFYSIENGRLKNSYCATDKRYQ